jgi:hypothetical protein
VDPLGALFILPALQSVLVGSYLGFAVVAAALVFDERKMFEIALLVAPIVALLYFVVTVERVRARIDRLDEPAISETVFRVQSEDGKQFLPDNTLPGAPETTLAVARRLATGSNFTVDGMRDLFAGDRAAISSYRDACIDQGLLRWRNPASRSSGVEQTAKGRAFFNGLAAGRPRPNTGPTTPAPLNAPFDVRYAGTAHTHTHGLVEQEDR